ncbi:MAG: hypothetical protein RIR99_649 [Actinomycetota bacterium]|jgi:hypothetical protein
MIQLTGNLQRRDGLAQVSGLIESIFELEHFHPKHFHPELFRLVPLRLQIFRLEPMAPTCGIAIESNQFALT